MLGFFGKKDRVTPMNEEEFEGISGALASRVLDAFGITKEQFEKVKAIIDVIEVDQDGDGLEIYIKMKSVTIKIEK